MRLREETNVKRLYKIAASLLDLPFCKVYMMIRLSDNLRCYLIDYENTPQRAGLQEEFDLWLSTGGIPFPSVIESWNENETLSIVLAEFRGAPLVDLVKMSKYPLQEEKIFSFFPELEDVFEGLQSLQVALPDIRDFSSRIFYSMEGKIRVLPAILCHLMNQKAPLPDPIKRSTETIPASRYLQSFGSLFCYLLTQVFPSNKELPERSKNILKDDIAGFLKQVFSGEIGSFQQLQQSFIFLNASRNAVRKTPLPSPPPAAVSKRERFGKWEPWFNAFKKTGIAAMQAISILAQVIFFLLFLVGTYYWESLKKFARACKRAYGKARSLTWEDITHFLKSEAKRAKTDLLQIRVSIAMLFPVSDVELMQFTRQLGTLIKAGVSFTQSLKILYQQTSNIRMRKAISTLYTEVTGKGSSLSLAMRKTSGIFSELYVNMVSASEVTGKMEEVLHQLADYLERSTQLKRKIKGAATYPLIIFIACFCLFAFFVYVILPRLIEIFAGMNIPYPLPTRILIAVVKFAHSPFIMLLSIFAAVVLFFPVAAFIRTVVGRSRLDQFKLAIPVFGRLYRKILLTRFCGTLGVMVRCGVSLLSALEATGRASGNEFFNDIVTDMIEKVRIGMPLHVIVRETLFFPSLVLSMVQIGEESGNLDNMLLKASDIYDGEVTYLLQQFVALIEPILMGIMGLVVGFVVLAVFMPIYAIIGGIH